MIFPSIMGTLVRIGLEALMFYKGSPILFTSVWPNFAGSVFLGFLIESHSYTSMVCSRGKGNRTWQKQQVSLLGRVLGLAMRALVSIRSSVLVHTISYLFSDLPPFTLDLQPSPAVYSRRSPPSSLISSLLCSARSPHHSTTLVRLGIVYCNEGRVWTPWQRLLLSS